MLFRSAYEKAAFKQAAYESAAEAASQYDALIDQLVHQHRTAFSSIDWQGIAARDLVALPSPRSDAEDKARSDLASYRPGWFERTFGGEKKQIRLKEAAIHKAIVVDRAQSDALLVQARKENSEIELARRLQAGDQSAIVEVINSRSKLGDLPFCLEALDLFFSADGELVAKVDGLDLEDMPDQSVTLLQSGKLSVKQLTPAKVHELHRANISSSAIRIGIELLRVVPVAAVTVVMETEILDAATGHIEAKPVLSLKLARQVLNTMALERTEAPAVVERLGAEMNWSPRKGFAAIADG